MASTSTSDACAAGSDDLPVRVYIEHTDAYQVVYHSNYFKFLWRAREAYVFGGGMATALDNLSFDPSAAGWDHLDVVAIDDCKFAQSAVLGDDLLVRTTLVGIGEGTLAMRQEVVRAADGALMLAATVTVAPTDINGAPAAIPPELRGACASGVGHADPTWLAEAAASMSEKAFESQLRETREGVGQVLAAEAAAEKLRAELDDAKRAIAAAAAAAEARGVASAASEAETARAAAAAETNAMRTEAMRLAAALAEKEAQLELATRAAVRRATRRAFIASGLASASSRTGSSAGGCASPSAGSSNRPASCA